MSRAIVLHSGGIDSTTCLMLAMRDHTEVECVTFNYGQKHLNEIEAATDIAEELEVPNTCLPVHIFKGQSALMDVTEMPKLTYEELRDAEGPSATYVPFRNGTFLSTAASYALHTGADEIYTGVHAEDARNWAYPDCTPEFVGAMQNAIYVGTYFEVRLVAPLQYLTKAEVVQLALALDAPLHLTLSCYEGRRPACGQCPTCISRLAAFKENGVPDPIEYESIPASMLANQEGR
jgi:7-cyano-7-deazaguanine synthase